MLIETQAEIFWSSKYGYSFRSLYNAACTDEYRRFCDLLLLTAYPLRVFANLGPERTTYFDQDTFQHLKLFENSQRGAYNVGRELYVVQMGPSLQVTRKRCVAKLTLDPNAKSWQLQTEFSGFGFFGGSVYYYAAISIPAMISGITRQWSSDLGFQTAALEVIDRIADCWQVCDVSNQGRLAAPILDRAMLFMAGADSMPDDEQN